MREIRARVGRRVLTGVALVATAWVATPWAAAAPQIGTQRAPDSDGDGLDDPLERVLLTNPDLADSDGDGASDGLEVARRSDPLLASDLPGPPHDSLRVGLVSRASAFAGYVRTISVVFLPEGYPAGDVDMQLVVLDANGNLQVLGESWLSGPAARRTFDFLPVEGDDQALLMVVGVDLPRTVIEAQGHMSAAVVLWYGADSAPEANVRRRDATDGFWLRHEGGGPVLFRRTAATPGAGTGESGFYLPIDPGEPPTDWESDQICRQGTIPVGYEGGVILSRVVQANCEEGWDAHCSPSECAGSVGDEYETVDPVGLIGG